MILKKFAILLKKVYDIDTLCVFLFSLNLHRREWKIEDKFMDKIQPQLYIYIYISKKTRIQFRSRRSVAVVKS